MQGKKILIIDDDIIFCDMLGELLRTEGAEVTVENDGASGLAVANELRPDLIVCDYMMPAMHGTQVLEAVRGGWGAKVPFILLTNMSQTEILPNADTTDLLCLLKTDWTLSQLVEKMSVMLGCGAR